MKNQCMKCGYSWETRVPNPRVCPHCKCRHYNESLKYKKKTDWLISGGTYLFHLKLTSEEFEIIKRKWKVPFLLTIDEKTIEITWDQMLSG